MACLSVRHCPSILRNRNIQSQTAENYDDLHRYSVEDYQFWMDLWQFFGIIYSIPPDKVRHSVCASQISENSIAGDRYEEIYRSSTVVSRCQAQLCRKPPSTKRRCNCLYRNWGDGCHHKLQLSSAAPHGGADGCSFESKRTVGW